MPANGADTTAGRGGIVIRGDVERLGLTAAFVAEIKRLARLAPEPWDGQLRAMVAER